MRSQALVTSAWMEYIPPAKDVSMMMIAMIIKLIMIVMMIGIIVLNKVMTGMRRMTISMMMRMIIKMIILMIARSVLIHASNYYHKYVSIHPLCMYTCIFIIDRWYGQHIADNILTSLKEKTGSLRKEI